MTPGTPEYKEAQEAKAQAEPIVDIGTVYEPELELELEQEPPLFAELTPEEKARIATEESIVADVRAKSKAEWEKALAAMEEKKALAATAPSAPLLCGTCERPVTAEDITQAGQDETCPFCGHELIEKEKIEGEKV